jgi:hypothetical protein
MFFFICENHDYEKSETESNVSCGVEWTGMGRKRVEEGRLDMINEGRIKYMEACIYEGVNIKVII